MKGEYYARQVPDEKIVMLSYRVGNSANVLILPSSAFDLSCISSDNLEPMPRICLTDSKPLYETSMKSIEAFAEMIEQTSKDLNNVLKKRTVDTKEVEKLRERISTDANIIRRYTEMMADFPL